MSLSTSLAFNDLESRFGSAQAFALLRTLENHEGVVEERVARLTNDQRLTNVFRIMRENSASKVRH